MGHYKHIGILLTVATDHPCLEKVEIRSYEYDPGSAPELPFWDIGAKTHSGHGEPVKLKLYNRVDPVQT